MKKAIFLSLFALLSVGSFAQTGTETVDYTTTTGDKGSFTITQIRGNQVSANLQALDAVSTTGFSVRTGSNTWALRSLVQGSTKVSITNGDGVAGNTSIDVNEANLSLTNIGGILPVAKLPTGIPNANLANNAITINGTSVALGGTRSITLQDAASAGGTVTSAVTFNGGMAAKVITVTATGTETATYTYVKCNAAASDITRTLPASPTDGFIITFKRINSTAGNTIIVPNTGQTLDTGSQVKLISQHRCVSFQYDAASTTWQVID